MSDPMIVLLASVALVVLVLLFTLIRFARSRSWRVLLQGLGIAVLIGGLWMIGFMDMVLGWFRAAHKWALQMSMDNKHTTGLAIGAAGVLLFLIGGLIGPVSRAEARERRRQRQERLEARAGTPAVESRTAARPVASSSTGASRVGAQANAAGNAKRASSVDPEDAEIENILRGHGIE